MLGISLLKVGPEKKLINTVVENALLFFAFVVNDVFLIDLMRDG